MLSSEPGSFGPIRMWSCLTVENRARNLLRNSVVIFLCTAWFRFTLQLRSEHGQTPSFRKLGSPRMQKTSLPSPRPKGKAEEPDSVTDVQTLLNRLHAFFMALEYLNICPYSRATGPLMYLQQLEQFRAECPGLPFVLMADTLIRKKVFRLQAEQRDTFATFQAALLDVLTNHRYLWNDARTKATLASNEVRKDMEQSQSDRTRVRSPDKTPSSKAARRKRARERQKQTMVGPAHKQARPAQEAVRPTLDKDKRIPESEWKAINSAGPSGATISIRPWAVQRVTSSDSNMLAWFAGPPILWLAITDHL